MGTGETQLPAANWYIEPGSGRKRWWDGNAWGAYAEPEASEVPPGGSSVTRATAGILEPFETDNPYLQRLFRHEAFGVVPDGCGELLRGLQTADPEERLVSAMRVRHGLAEGGILMVTTHWLRYVKQGRLFTAIANDEFWPLDGALEFKANIGDTPLFVTPDGHQFQIFPKVPIVSGRKGKAFLEIYKLVVLASAHLNTQIETAAMEGMASAGAGSSMATEIKELAALHESGALTEAEFEAAKARVLSA